MLRYLRVISMATMSLDAIAADPVALFSPQGTVKPIRQVHALDRGWTLWQTLEHIGEIPSVSSRAAGSIKSCLGLISRWRGMLQQTDEPFSVRALMDDVIRSSGIQAYLEKIGGSELQEKKNVDELISDAGE